MKFENIETFLKNSNKTKIKPFLRKSFYFEVSNSLNNYCDLYIFSDSSSDSFCNCKYWFCPTCKNIFTSDERGSGCVKCKTNFFINANYKRENCIYAWLRIRLTYFFQLLGVYFKS